MAVPDEILYLPLMQALFELGIISAGLDNYQQAERGAVNKLLAYSLRRKRLDSHVVTLREVLAMSDHELMEEVKLFKERSVHHWHALCTRFKLIE